MSAVTELWAASFEAELSNLATTQRAARPLLTGWDDRREFLASLPPGYTEETSPQDAAVDWLEMSSLLGGEPEADEAGRQPSPVGLWAAGASRLVLCPCRPGAPGDFRLRRVGLARVELSSFLPVLESFGLAVVEAVPWRFQFGPAITMLMWTTSVSVSTRR